MDADILGQLVQIKWLLAALALLALCRVLLRAWVEIRRSGGPKQLMLVHFEQQARQLLDEGQDGQLLALARERCDEAPRDALALWPAPSPELPYRRAVALGEPRCRSTRT